jgi:hypothetical protein
MSDVQCTRATEALCRFLQTEWAGPYIARVSDFIPDPSTAHGRALLAAERAREGERPSAIERLTEADADAEAEAMRQSARAIEVVLGTGELLPARSYDELLNGIEAELDQMRDHWRGSAARFDALMSAARALLERRMPPRTPYRYEMVPSAMLDDLQAALRAVVDADDPGSQR